MGGSSDPVSFEKGGASSDCSHLRPSHFCNVLLLCNFFQLGRGDGAGGGGRRVPNFFLISLYLQFSGVFFMDLDLGFGGKMSDLDPDKGTWIRNNGDELLRTGRRREEKEKAVEELLLEKENLLVEAMLKLSDAEQNKHNLGERDFPNINFNLYMNDNLELIEFCDN